MNAIEEIKEAVERLTPEDLDAFRSWYLEFDAQRWDEQFERDAKSGKLDQIAERAVQQYRAGNYSEL